jgi:hypothetical protein
MYISKNWTPEERLTIIAKIAGEMFKHPMFGRDEKFTDWQERLTFLSIANGSLLELNRDSIINGKSVSPIKKPAGDRKDYIINKVGADDWDSIIEAFGDGTLAEIKAALDDIRPNNDNSELAQMIFEEIQNEE